MAGVTEYKPADPGALKEWVRWGTNHIPVLPELANRVICVAANPDTSIAQLAGIISKDQVLVTRLLSLANSAYSAPAFEVRTINEAIMRVGASGVRNLAVTVCFASRMHDRRVYGALGPALVDHGIGTAYVAHLVADACREDPDEAFLCGLLHDIGKLVILKWFDDVARRTGTAAEPAEVARVMRQWHPTIAGLCFRRWGLPAELDEPVMCHHEYTQAASERRMAAIIYLANRLSHKFGFGGTPEEFEPADDPAANELGLSADALAAIAAKAPGLFQVAKQGLM